MGLPELMKLVRFERALRDFTIWPSPTRTAERAAAESRFKETQQQQLTQMWDQSQH
jgi:hypothetical protein